jgi:ABC-2 type transport system ATP-binding protein
MALAASQLSHRYGDQPALVDVSLVLSAPVTALVGVNGAGKTTLLNVLAGALAPRAGRVTLDGDNLYSKSRRRLLPHIALMPQTFSYPGAFTVREFVEYLGWMRGLPRSEVRRAAAAAIDQVILSDRAEHQLKTLSGGMIRRVGLAQALVSQPSVLLLDEPTTGLDPEQRASMRDLIARLPHNTTVLMSSHVMEDVERIAQRVVLIDDTRLIFDDTVAALQALAPSGAAGRAEVAFLSLVAAQRGAGE